MKKLALITSGLAALAVSATMLHAAADAPMAEDGAMAEYTMTEDAPAEEEPAM